MLNSQIFYLIGEAFRGWRQHKAVILPSLITIFLCSFLLCGTLIFLNAMNNLSSQDGELYRLEAFLNDNVKTLPNETIKDIKTWKEVDSVSVISSEVALKEFSKKFGHEMLDLVNENPLPASIRVLLNKDFRSGYQIGTLKNRLEDMNYFQEINTNMEIISWIETHKFNFTFWPIAITILLFGTLWLIIANSVRLTLYSRSLLVENMKYCGGSNAFIQLPFVFEGALQGFIGSLLGALSWVFLLWILSSNLSIVQSLSINSGFIFISVVLLVTLIGSYTSYKIVREFLQKEV